MSRVIEATCQGNIVTAEGVPVPGTTILSEGVGQSEGILILDRDKRTYIPKTSPDLKQTLEKIVAGLNTIATTLESIGAGMTGPTTAPPPDLATNVAQIQQTATELQTLMGALK